MNISPNVIDDLLPIYAAGEASQDTCDLIDEYARHHPELADKLALLGTTPDGAFMLSSPADSTAKRILTKVRRQIMQQIGFAAMFTAILLTIPLGGHVFSEQVNWSLGDFIVMGAMLFTCMMSYRVITQVNGQWRVATVLTLLTCFLLIWINLAVGIIGEPGNPANTLYIFVLAVIVTGGLYARFTANGLAKTCFAAALAQSCVPILAFVVWPQAMNEPPGVIGIFLINLVFVTMLLLAGSLFLRASRQR